MKPQQNKPPRAETVVVLLLAFFCNEAVYLGARRIAHTWPHYDMTTPLDQMIPFLPWTITVYLGCYVFWAANYYLCARQAPAERDRFFCADLLAKLVCFALFLLIPTTNIRPEITGGTIWDSAMALLYRLDRADNLFPSIHCLVSWFCWIGVRHRKDILAWYRRFSLAAATAVCLSTLTTVQHVLADAAGSLLLAELCWYLAARPKVCARYTALLQGIKRILHL